MEKEIYFLSEYNWQKGILLAEGSKNYKIYIPANGCFLAQTKPVPKEKCAFPDEIVCVVWEQWKGKNGRGGYRVEKELYPNDRVRADRVNYQHVGGLGRLDEISLGTKR
jgi:hypothetical protein